MYESAKYLSKSCLQVALAMKLATRISGGLAISAIYQSLD